MRLGGVSFHGRVVMSGPNPGMDPWTQLRRWSGKKKCRAWFSQLRLVGMRPGARQGAEMGMGDLTGEETRLNGRED